VPYISAGSVTKPQFHLCSVCHQDVELQSSKTDEFGQAVHEECYVPKVTSKFPSVKVSEVHILGGTGNSSK
jgi:hypothetical protein